ncbi:MAG: hypothetical protein CL908_25010 [Deltaproteobacteria bacterium]|nr:hypothetical protein [Deltaproteobacteria bacterium]
MEWVCPYCEALALVREGDGAVQRCTVCGRSSLPGAAAKRPASAASGTSPATGADAGQVQPDRSPSRQGRGAPGEVPSLPAALIAIAVTVVFYGLLRIVPTGRIGELFVERGWVPYVITTISLWAVCLLGAKLRRLRRERELLGRDLMAGVHEGPLRPEDASEAIGVLHSKGEGVRESFVACRVERALRHFALRRRVDEVVDFLASESRADEGRVDASYALVRVFVWAVPTLGFIGTVIGIGAAVAGFSETLDAAASLDGMKESIGSVTGGLGVAFDTTLLALVMSILIMFPASAVQRFEEVFLAEVDDYCADVLVWRLADEAGSDADERAAEALAQRLLEAMRARERAEC